MINWLKRLFCKHTILEKTNIITYYKPSYYEARGNFYEAEGLKCSNCGKLFK